jgi:hypothetical protein
MVPSAWLGRETVFRDDCHNWTGLRPGQGRRCGGGGGGGGGEQAAYSHPTDLRIFGLTLHRINNRCTLL